MIDTTYIDNETKSGRLNAIRFFGYISVAIVITSISLHGAISQIDTGYGFLISLACMYFISSKFALNFMYSEIYESFINRLIFYIIYCFSNSVLTICIFGILDIQSVTPS